MSTAGFTWSPQQSVIHNWFQTSRVKNGSYNDLFRAIIVQARAGCSKTTTAIEGVSRATDPRILIAAFNKEIADELDSRVKKLRTKSEINARSLHSVGNGIVWTYLGQRRSGSVTVDGARGRRLARKVIESAGLTAPDEIITAVKKLSSLGKNCKPFARSGADLVQLGEDFACHAPVEHAEEWPIEAIADFAYAAMELATKREENTQGQAVIDYDDQVFLPVRMRWARPRWDLVVIDEAQDMCPTQLELCLMVAKNRICVIGDDRQAIYGFRGADSQAFENLKARLKAPILPLNITYRCPRTVVELAQNLVPDFTAAPAAPEGQVQIGNVDNMLQNANVGDFILSRVNAPLAKICLKLLRRGVRARIRGRKEVVGQLRDLVRSLDATDIPDLIIRVRAWAETNVNNIMAKVAGDQDAEPDEKALEHVTDTAETIIELCQDLATVPELFGRFEALFSDDVVGNTVMCSTIHRAKGLETERVYVLAETLRAGGEEDNLAYVAYTRAKETLVLVRGSV